MGAAEKIIEEIEALKVRGAFLNAVRALDALVILSKELQEQTSEPYCNQMIESAERLERANPSWAIVGTGCRFTTGPLMQNETRQLATAELHEMIERRADVFQETIKRAQTDVSLVGANLIESGSTIVLISYSGTLIEMLREAWKMGKRFRVIGTESRPNLEGHHMAAILLEQGVPYTLITDAALTHFVGEADLALVGVDTLLATGAVINKIGTMPLALACRHFGKPLFAVTSSYKMSIPSLQGEGVELKAVDEVAGIAPQHLLENPNLKVCNLFFEVTPSNFFEGLVSEYGVYPPSAARTLWERSSNLLEEQIAKSSD